MIGRARIVNNGADETAFMAGLLNTRAYEKSNGRLAVRARYGQIRQLSGGIIFSRLSQNRCGLRCIVDRDELTRRIARSLWRKVPANGVPGSTGKGLCDKVMAVVSGTFDRDEDISVFHKSRIYANMWSVF